MCKHSSQHSEIPERGIALPHRHLGDSVPYQSATFHSVWYDWKIILELFDLISSWRNSCVVSITYTSETDFSVPPPPDLVFSIESLAFG
jgi:hypothetical protein